MQSWQINGSFYSVTALECQWPQAGFMLCFRYVHHKKLFSMKIQNNLSKSNEPPNENSQIILKYKS